VAVLVFVLGVLAFIPFHLLKRAGVSEGLIVAAHLGACAALGLYVRARDAVPLPRVILAIPISLHTLFAVVLLTDGASGQKLAAIASAAVASIAFALVLPLHAVAKSARSTDAHTPPSPRATPVLVPTSEVNPPAPSND
jgi:hypothetical protein